MVIRIPSKGEFDITNIVFDYNGTLSESGKLLNHIKADLIKASEVYNLYVITADTYGTVTEECREFDIEVVKIKGIDEALEKSEFVRKLDPTHTLSIGNGMNDTGMLLESAISIAVIGPEGCAGKLLTIADIVVKDIKDVFNLMFESKRIIATLRK